MPDSTPIDPVDLLERQIRRVRRRRNWHELQRTLYILIATAAGSAALLVIFALGSSARLFAVAAWSVVAVVVVTAALLQVEMRRRWLGAARAAAWIDARAGLHGRLATLVETRARGPRAADAFFLPLLAEENAQRLAAWRPARLVPRRVPRGPLAVALATSGILLLALALAPGLRPQPPEIIYSDRPLDGLETDEGGLPDRVIVAPARPRAGRRDRRAATAADGHAVDDEESALARLSSQLQDRIRRELWGEAWERMRDAMASAESNPSGGADPPGEFEGDDGEAHGEEWEADGLPSALIARPRGRAIEGASEFERRDDGRPDDPAEPADAPNDDGSTTGGSARAAGAGNGTDPNLFGPPSAGRGGAGEMFELAISAPVRARRGAPRPSAGDAPAPAPDARPELAAHQREQGAVRRMAVPPAYETIVREVFAHRGGEGEARP